MLKRVLKLIFIFLIKIDLLRYKIQLISATFGFKISDSTTNLVEIFKLAKK